MSALEMFPAGSEAPQSTPSQRPKAIEVLGITADNEIAYRFDGGEVMYLTEDDLGVLTREISRDFLPLWPTQHCRHCGTDSVVVNDGDPFCEAHAMAYGKREDEGGI